MSDRELKSLRYFLEKCLDKTVLNFVLSDLTKAGDNYGSVLQSLEVAVADENNRVSNNCGPEKKKKRYRQKL